MSIWQRRANGIQAVLSSKKAPKRNKREAQHRAIDVMLGFSSLQQFLADKAILCSQESLSHFAKWRKNALCRKIPRPKAYRVRSAELRFLMRFFRAERKNITVFTTFGFNKAFLLPHSNFTQ